MSELINLNDIQIKDTSPFFEATKDFLDWTIDQEWNNENNYLFINGDFYERSHPRNKEVGLALRFLRKCKFKKIWIMKGNHDYSYNAKNALIPLQEAFDNVEVISDYKVIVLGKLNILAMPYMFPHEVEVSMVEYYNNLPEEILNQSFTHAFYHFDDETIPFSKGIDLSYLNIELRYGGHIHTSGVSKHYHGVPVIRRFDEAGQHNKILSINIEENVNEFIDVPKFLDYETVKYPDDLNFTYKYTIFNITDVPKKSVAEDYYKNKYKDKKLYFRSFEKLKEDRKNEKVVEKDKKKNNIISFFSEFCEERNTNNYVKDICLENIKKVENFT